jgi:ubiquinone/menaquinone biosynthesis C-methylase UbiE
MPERSLSPDAARRTYDRLAAYYDWFSLYEAHAKQAALERLALAPGLRLLNVGLGTGKYHDAIPPALAPGGMAVGLDLAWRMLAQARQRGVDLLVQADGGGLPFAPASFDRLLCTYVLDLVNLAAIPEWLAGFRRALRPGGRMVLLSLTEGVNLPSRGFVALWKAAYAISPLACGGCRPLQLSQMAQQAGFTQVEREVVVQWGVPSELLVAS